MRVFFGYQTPSSFVERDLRVIRSQYPVVSRQLRHNNPLRFVADVYWAARSDVLYFWFASLRIAPLVWFGSLLSKKIVIVVGGYEAANLPDINYGSARRPTSRAVVRFMLRRAVRVLAVSRASLDSIVKNLEVPRKRITLIYHGFADSAGELRGAREKLVVTIGAVNEITWLRKGLKEFFEVAALMPDVRFVHIGPVELDIEKKLGAKLSDNVILQGEVPFSHLGDYLGSAKVCFQLSRHESFGCAVADAMLFGLIPVVSDLYSLPEVVGDCGIIVKSYDLDRIAGAVREALAMPDSEANRCRQWILTQFSETKRAESVLGVLREVET
jgi:glycosyltransferase involved in cell wall biosynthesis